MFFLRFFLFCFCLFFSFSPLPTLLIPSNFFRIDLLLREPIFGTSRHSFFPPSSLCCIAVFFFPPLFQNFDSFFFPPFLSQALHLSGKSSLSSCFVVLKFLWVFFSFSVLPDPVHFFSRNHLYPSVVLNGFFLLTASFLFLFFFLFRHFVISELYSAS